MTHGLTVHEHPFPHLVTDNFWPDPDVAAALREVNTLTGWRHFHNEREEKWTVDFREVPDACPAIHAMRGVLASEAFRSALTDVFGIPNLQFDPIGGGVHKIKPGGFLGTHVDFNRSDDGRWRRINALVYLQGQPFAGGDLELGEGPAKHIPLRGNRTVIFQCSETSWHGHPRPYTGEIDRISLAAYYFTDEPPEGDLVPPHSTIFLPS